MKVRVYPDGCLVRARDYDERPDAAAKRYAEEQCTGTSVDLVVVPLDDEAVGSLLWRSDEDGLYLLFRASAQTTWSVDRVKSFKVHP